MKVLFAWFSGLVFAAQAIVCNAHAEHHPHTTEPAIIGYVFSPDKPLKPDSIAAEKLTHINYAFSNIESGRIVNGFDFDDQNYRLLQTLKERNPKLKILSSVGGWTWSGGFSDMALTEQSRQVFIDSAVEFVRRHQLDGIDIDWEYPGLVGAGNTHRPEDGRNFTLVLKGLRTAFDSLAQELERPLLITIASGGFPDYLAKSDIGNWQKYLDYINIMAYDYNFPREDGVTGHHTALYSHPDDASGQSADAAVKNHMAAGVPAHKLVVGVAFYGRTWVNVSPKNSGLNQSADAGEASFGSARYDNLRPNVIGKKGYRRYWDEVAQAPWLWSEKEQTFVSYDDPQSIAAKVKYIRQQDLGGVMFWQYTSDYNNELLNTINKALGWR
ncbi:glycoside hydrolase family 18 protein [Gilvimarinus sp. DA14]|uniref:glycoside hydrolase family 18 protein n=1 Tax=Gilvimarinus sp. DA14 TaxID=2956798 RepID=UPI0020B881C9|nr:glycoside hydrolase family 18 protein [Gilvimarinus sp. DA14]UTF61635.1 glycoside hydrolase family 18 protein [Gilvimarinus sp. DA14]